MELRSRYMLWVWSSEDSNFSSMIEISVVKWIAKRLPDVSCTEPETESLAMKQQQSSIRNKQFTLHHLLKTRHFICICLMVACDIQKQYMIYWKTSSTCLYFLKEFLTFIKHTTKNNPLGQQLFHHTQGFQALSSQILKHSEVHWYLKPVHLGKEFLNFLNFCKWR